MELDFQITEEDLTLILLLLWTFLVQWGLAFKKRTMTTKLTTMVGENQHSITLQLFVLLNPNWKLPRRVCLLSCLNSRYLFIAWLHWLRSQTIPLGWWHLNRNHTLFIHWPSALKSTFQSWKAKSKIYILEEEHISVQVWLSSNWIDFSAIECCTKMYENIPESVHSSNRIFLLTDMEASQDDGVTFVKKTLDNSNTAIWTTVIGIGLDLTGDIINKVSTTPGCNYSNVR